MDNWTLFLWPLERISNPGFAGADVINSEIPQMESAEPRNRGQKKWLFQKT